MSICHHCEINIETEQSGIINCPNCDWKVLVKNTNIRIETECYSNNKIKTIRHLINGTLGEILHNPNGPALIRNDKNGNISFKGYFIKGQPHNSNGPAKFWYLSDGKIKLEEYWINGVFQREVKFQHTNIS